MGSAGVRPGQRLVWIGATSRKPFQPTHNRTTPRKKQNNRLSLAKLPKCSQQGNQYFNQQAIVRLILFRDALKLGVPTLV